MILKKIADATRLRVMAQKSDLPLKEIKNRLQQPARPFAFEKALATKDLSFICEVKKASPSRGVIAHNFPYVQIAKEYEAAGAGAISVLTEPDFFMGSGAYLSEIKKHVSVPLLRKDFILDEYQIYEAALLGADAVLLICALLDTQTLKSFIELADSLGLSSLVEAHNASEVSSALAAKARIIGVNNRDLRTFTVDITNSLRLRPLVPPEILFVSESGIKTPSDIASLRSVGTNAVLIGETLMFANNKKEILDRLKGDAP